MGTQKISTKAPIRPRAKLRQALELIRAHCEAEVDRPVTENDVVQAAITAFIQLDPKAWVQWVKATFGPNDAAALIALGMKLGRRAAEASLESRPDKPKKSGGMP